MKALKPYRSPHHPESLNRGEALALVGHNVKMVVHADDGVEFERIVHLSHIGPYAGPGTREAVCLNGPNPFDGWLGDFGLTMTQYSRWSDTYLLNLKTEECDLRVGARQLTYPEDLRSPYHPNALTIKEIVGLIGKKVRHHSIMGDGSIDQHVITIHEANPFARSPGGYPLLGRVAASGKYFGHALGSFSSFGLRPERRGEWMRTFLLPI